MSRIRHGPDKFLDQNGRGAGDVATHEGAHRGWPLVIARYCAVVEPWNSTRASTSALSPPPPALAPIATIAHAQAGARLPTDRHPGLR